MNCKFFTIACALLSMSFCSWANENKTDSVGYQFTVTKELKTNPVKDQRERVGASRLYRLSKMICCVKESLR